jgi:hypothetical protein
MDAYFQLPLLFFHVAVCKLAQSDGERENSPHRQFGQADD